MLTIEIKSPKLENIYTKAEIQNIFDNFIKELEEKEEPLKLYQASYKNLTKEQQETIDKVRKGEVEELDLIEC